jgi:hypothetical protein
MAGEMTCNNEGAEMPKKYENNEDRILQHYKEDDNGCWIWQKSKDNHGYGMVRDPRSSRSEKAHRVSYRMFVGDIPEGKSVCHSCDVRACVNPDHLYCGTAKDNMRDAVERGRLSKKRTTLTPEQKKQIVILKEGGATKIEIAEAFGVCQQVVQKYWKGNDVK